MNQVWLVARWEFLGTVMRGGFVGTAFALPLVHLAIALLLGFALQSATPEDAAARPVAVVGKASEAHALRQLQERSVDAVFVRSDDYLQSGRMRVYSHRGSGLFTLTDNLERRERAERVLREHLLAGAIEPAIAARVLTPIVTLEHYTVDRGSGVARRDDGSPLGPLTGVFGLGLLLSLAIFISSGLLQQAMAAERHNRILEVLLVSVTPLRLLMGKVAGLAAAGLIQIGVYLGLVVGLTPSLLGMADISPATLGLASACFLAGYILYACLMAATGALGRDTQESAQIATAWVVVGASPMFLITVFSNDQASVAARILTWVPLTSPVAVLLRLGSGSIGAVEIGGALALTLVAAAGALVISSRLLRRVTIAGAR